MDTPQMTSDEFPRGTAVRSRAALQTGVLSSGRGSSPADFDRHGTRRFSAGLNHGETCGLKFCNQPQFPGARLSNALNESQVPLCILPPSSCSASPVSRHRYRRWNGARKRIKRGNETSGAVPYHQWIYGPLVEMVSEQTSGTVQYNKRTNQRTARLRSVLKAAARRDAASPALLVESGSGSSSRKEKAFVR